MTLDVLSRFSNKSYISDIYKGFGIKYPKMVDMS